MPHMQDKDREEKANIEELFQNLSCSSIGLSELEADNRLRKFGPNAIEERKEKPSP